MKRLNNSTAADTDVVQPGADNVGASENIATDHTARHPDDTGDILKALLVDASLAPALPAYARLTDAQVAAARQTG